MRRLIILGIIFLNTLYIIAQDGYVFLSNYQVPIQNIDYHNTSVIQDDNGVLYFANTRGVLSYDGIRWKLIETPGTPYALAKGANGTLFVGCSNSYGYLTSNNNGIILYQAISTGKALPDEISGIITHKGMVFFFSNKIIYKVNENTLTNAGSLKTPASSYFSGIFIHQDQLYINITGKGLHRLQNNTNLKPIPGGRVFAWSSIITSMPFSKGQCLLGTGDNTLFIFNGKNITSYIFESQEYVSGSRLSGCINLSTNEFALSTLSGGVLIIEKKNGKKKRIINYQSGLQDDEVLAMCTDKHGGLWICNEYGISRADLSLPLQNFSSYLGLEGNITTVIRPNKTLYVATNEGLFYLTRVTDISEVQNLIKKEHKQTTSTQIYRTIKSVTKLIKVTFSTKDIAPVTKRIPITIEVPVDSVSTSVQDVFTDREIRKTYAMQSIPFMFKRIKGIEAKCKQLISYNNTILVATNIGLFEVDSIKATQAIKDRNINFICTSSFRPMVFYMATDKGLIIVEDKGNAWVVLGEINNIQNGLSSLVEDGKYIWAGGTNKVYKILISDIKNPIVNKSFKVPNNFNEQIVVCKINGSIAFFSNSGVYTLDGRMKALIKPDALQKFTTPASDVLINQPGSVWIDNNNHWRNISSKINDTASLVFLKLFKDIKDIYTDNDKNIWVVDGNALYRVMGKAHLTNAYRFDIAIRNIRDKKDQPQSLDQLRLRYNNNALTIDLAAFFFLNEKNTEYSYRMEGIEKSWSEWETQPVLSFPFLPSGSYTLHVKARNIFSQISDEKQIDITIGTPFWKTWWFYMLLAVIIIAAVYYYMRQRTLRLEMQKRILEKKVQDATSEIRAQSDVIQKKNEDITASINYAQRIQEAFLPWDETIKKALPESFVFYRPRDIVSGDFYWFYEEKKTIIIIAADCTGHGVPGAFMSMIGNALLNQIIKEMKITSPEKILNLLDVEVVKALKQDAENAKSKDGMDITICTIRKDKNMIEFAGANNPLYYVKNGVLEVIRGNPFGIGGIHPIYKVKEYTKHEIAIDCETFCYMSSDGYPDQNGGLQDRKFMSANFKKLVLDIHQKSYEEQKSEIGSTLDNWIGKKHQRDDILVMGFKVQPFEK